MVYYNQRNYANVPYPSASLPKATIATGGCGVCCASMIVENLLGQSFKPSESAKFSLSCGARVNGGTDMAKLSKALCSSFSLKYDMVESINAVKSEMKSNAMAIAHAKGGTQGLFSTSGHFVVLAKFDGNQFTVLDPYLYKGKYDTKYRKGKVTQSGNLLYVSPQNIDNDCKKYYIFKRWNDKMENINVEQAKQILKQKAGLSDITIQFLYNYRYGDDLLIKLATAMR